MKITITNFELERYIEIISNQNSFRNNVNIKIPASLDWTLRINLKLLFERYALLNELRTDISKRFSDEGKVAEDEVHLKDEFVQEYNEQVTSIMLQKNEFDFTPIEEKDFCNIELSMPERDFLMLMVDNSQENDEIKDNQND